MFNPIRSFILTVLISVSTSVLSQVKITVGNTTATEGQELVFQLNSPGTYGSSYDVEIQISSNNAVLNEDFLLRTAKVTFNGTTAETKEVHVLCMDDDIVEPSETLHLVMTSTNPGLDLSSIGTGTIVDNDLSVVSARSISVKEGELLEFEITSAKEVIGGFTITSTVNPIGAGITADDYSVVNPTLVFKGAPGESQVLVVKALNDKIAAEGAETFQLVLASTNTSIVFS